MLPDGFMAICLRCGSGKPRALDTCGSCGSGPRTRRDYLVSAALSLFLSSEEELGRYRDEVITGKPPSIPQETYQRALQALEDPAALAALRSRPLGAVPTAGPADAAPVGPATGARTAAPHRPVHATAQSTARDEAAATPPTPLPRGAPRSLAESPFALLGATIHDGRRRIGELAEARVHELGEDAARRARTALTHPANRLAAEMEWLPGLDPVEAARLFGTVCREPLAIREEPVQATLAHLNLIATAIRAIERDPRDWPRWCATWRGWSASSTLGPCSRRSTPIGRWPDSRRCPRPMRSNRSSRYGASTSRTRFAMRSTRCPRRRWWR
jgi:hypothetical protein